MCAATRHHVSIFMFFFFNDTATTEIYTLSLHDALPIWYVMRAWYDVVGDGSEDAAGIRASQARVEALIAREKARGFPAARVVLAGFSQGGAMALHPGLPHPERLAGILPLPCYPPLGGTPAPRAGPGHPGAALFQ